MGKVKLYLIRHGKTYLNQYEKMQGWADSPLTEEGKVVALETGKKLANISFDRVYTSDLGRTVETAEILLGQNHYNDNLAIRKTKEFRELFFGSFEGEYNEVAWSKVAKEKGLSSNEEMIRDHPMEEIVESMHKADPLHQAESFEEFSRRIKKGLELIIAERQKEDENILLVSHGVVIMHLIHKFSDEPIIPIEINNSSISHIEYAEDKYKVISYNQ
ncbi:histidine phosphatase family protein [Aquibacillus sediminis]|uniref:histidine phosphatase family protein n=1 Tax=Aquibacillus sediminis TaxID=2574734 RepID=UPI001486F5AE|nr:histidine phosphatase family protein [Aquibacillus sediminis]